MCRTGSLEDLQCTPIRERGGQGKHGHCSTTNGASLFGETNIIYERFMLNQRAQAEGETFDQYLTA